MYSTVVIFDFDRANNPLFGIWARISRKKMRIVARGYFDLNKEECIIYRVDEDTTFETIDKALSKQDWNVYNIEKSCTKFKKLYEHLEK